MTERVLVAYATKCGSTAEVAQAVGRVLTEAGAEVTLAPVQKIKDLSPYTAVVLGTCIRMGKPVREALRFARRFQGVLNERPSALFSVGLSLREKTPENNQLAVEYVQPLREIFKPVSLGVFAGKVDHSKLGLPMRIVAQRDDTGALAEGDWRDWESIEDWARGLPAVLMPDS